MKVGILTQPLSNNYGGLLQAYALQTTMERMGHEVVILNRRMPFVPDVANDAFVPSAIRFAKNCVKFLMRKPLIKVYHELLPQQGVIVNRLTEIFIVTYHHKSPDFSTTESLTAYCRKQGIEAYVVGSDQCWRPLYSPCLPNCFLDFARDWNVRRISYAASFGVDYWEYTEEDTRLCAPLVQKFDAVSVREESGIALCKEHLGVDAIHVLDPTMLLDTDDYNALVQAFDPKVFNIAQEHRVKTTLDVKDKKLFCYVLNMNVQKQAFI